MSWESLSSILAEARQSAIDEYSTPPQACPNDGEPLVEVDGVLFCRFDGYEWPTDGYRL